MSKKRGPTHGLYTIIYTIEFQKSQDFRET